MDSRRHPRSLLKASVRLVCPARGISKVHRSRDISMGGMFVVGTCLAHPGAELRIEMLGDDPEGPVLASVEAVVERVCMDGFGVSFRNAGRQFGESVAEQLLPRWNGEHLLDGVMILSRYMDAADLPQLMSLTSFASHHFRRCAKTRRCRLHL